MQRRLQDAKVPAIAVGTAVAGMVGGIFIGRAARPRLPWERRDGLSELAKQLSRAGRGAGDLAEEVHRLREQASEAQRQSPIEVVLNGLTARRLPRR